MRIRPDFDEFAALAADHTVVPVWAEVLADLTTPSPHSAESSATTSFCSSRSTTATGGVGGRSSVDARREPWCRRTVDCR